MMADIPCGTALQNATFQAYLVQSSASRAALDLEIKRVDGPWQANVRFATATVGRNAAVAQIGGRRYTGFIAWLIWLAVHIFFLIGFRNRLGVLINWAWTYLFYERAVRLILPHTARRRVD